MFFPSLRATVGSEAIQKAARKNWIASATRGPRNDRKEEIADVRKGDYCALIILHNKLFEAGLGLNGAKRGIQGVAGDEQGRVASKI